MTNTYSRKRRDSFIVRGPVTINDVPKDLRDLKDSMQTFKANLDEFQISQESKVVGANQWTSRLRIGSGLYIGCKHKYTALYTENT